MIDPELQEMLGRVVPEEGQTLEQAVRFQVAQVVFWAQLDGIPYDEGELRAEAVRINGLSAWPAWPPEPPPQASALAQDQQALRATDAVRPSGPQRRSRR